MRPHIRFFLFYNLLYLAPVAWITFYTFEENGFGNILIKRDTLRDILIVYLTAILSFCAGSALPAFLRRTQNLLPIAEEPAKRNKLSLATKILCTFTVAAYLTSKVLLIPLGVYHSYAFDSGSMTGGLWSASTALSEALVLFSLVILFSDEKHNVRWFLCIFGINGINLLHGTRIFFIVTGLGFCLYLYQTGRLTKKLAVGGFLAVAFLSYFVFLHRSNISVESDSFSLARMVVPIMAESVFSQFSLISVLETHVWSLFGAPHQFIFDFFAFTAPRLILPDKDSLYFMNKFQALSPLGGFSGYAQGLLYFGYFFPLAYFVLGVTADWLARKSSSSGFWAIVYVYFVSDPLFRIMRDGYLIPIKVLIDSLVILLSAVIFQRMLVMAGDHAHDNLNNRQRPH